MFWIAQLFGFIGFLIVLTEFQFNKRKTILSLRCATNTFYGIHYYMLNATTAAFIQIFAIIRNIVFLQRSGKQYWDSKIWLYLFMTSYIVVGIFTWNGVTSILSVLGAVFGTLALWCKNPTHIRAVSLLCEVSWIIHSILVRSYAGLITNLFIMGSILVGMYRFDRKHFFA